MRDATVVDLPCESHGPCSLCTFGGGHAECGPSSDRENRERSDLLKIRMISDLLIKIRNS